MKTDFNVVMTAYRGADAASQGLLNRIAAQVTFAEGLVRLGELPNGQLLCSDAAGVVHRAATQGGVDAIANAVAEAEHILDPFRDAAKRYTIHCVGHGHIDMNWMWPWQETVAITNDTVTTVLKLMEEFPDFCFSQSQASIYEIMRQYSPHLFDQVKKRVAEGRWEITACEWVEGDKNLPTGESLARHLLYTRRYMAEHFGLTPADIPIAWNPDTFGHAHTIPMIYTRGGVTRYYMCRGGDAQKPPVFWWQSADGSRLLVNYEHTWYNDAVGPHNIAGLLAFCQRTKLKDWMLVYGVGDHGGGPTRQDIRLCMDMNRWPVFPNFRFATTRHYFEVLEKHGNDWPTFDGELNYEFTGCYTSQSSIKRTNRFAEHHLERAETAAVLAYTALGRVYPHAELRQAWLDTLFGHFHDILPGSGAKDTREYHNGIYQRTTATTAMVATNALRALAAHMDTARLSRDAELGEGTQMGAGAGRGSSEGGVSAAHHALCKDRVFVVFNPTAWGRQEVVKLTIWDAELDNVHSKQYAARTADGRSLPVQRLDAGDYWGHRFVELAVAASVPPLGYASIIVSESGYEPLPIRNSLGYPPMEETALPGGVHHLARQRKLTLIYDGPAALDNGLIYVEFDPNTGGIINLRRKESDTSVFAADQPGALLEYVLERPHLDSAWVTSPPSAIARLGAVLFEPSAPGPNQAGYKVKYRLNESEITVHYVLKMDSPMLEIAIDATWLERGSDARGVPSLRMMFPFTFGQAVGTYEIPFGAITREPKANQEVPAQRWINVAGTEAGCAVLNDCKYGYSLDRSTLHAVLIRSTYEPDPFPEYGRHHVRFALMPHCNSVSMAQLFMAGAAFNQPLQVVTADMHSGTLPVDSADVLVSRTANVVVTSIKKAEDEDAIIVRLLETQGDNAVARIEVDQQMIGKIIGAEEVDLIERRLAENTARVCVNGFTVEVKARSIASIRVTLARRPGL